VPSPRVALAASMLLLATVWIGSHSQNQATEAEKLTPDAQYQMINDLPVLEDFDVLSSFEPLTDLPQPVTTENAN
jgi:hypothetical protein